jgi:hypothetical protein
MIDRAIGVVMGRTGCGSAEAAARLRTLGHVTGRAVAEVARSMLDESPTTPRNRHHAYRLVPTVGSESSSADLQRSNAEDVRRLAVTATRQISEDEAVARAAADAGAGSIWTWRDDRTGASLRARPDDEWLGDRNCQPGLYAARTGGGAAIHLLSADGDVPAAAAAHMTRFDPAKALTACRTRRLLVEALLGCIDTNVAPHALRLMVGDTRRVEVGHAGMPSMPEPDWYPYPPPPAATRPRSPGST